MVLPVSLECVTLPTRTGSEVVKFNYINWILMSPTMLLISGHWDSTFLWGGMGEFGGRGKTQEIEQIKSG